MSFNAAQMKSFRENSQIICETYDLDAFTRILQRRNLASVVSELSTYEKQGLVVPRSGKNNKILYDIGHFVLLLRIQQASRIRYDVGTTGTYDFEDVMLRRTKIADLVSEHIVEDTKQFHAFFSWIWSDGSGDYDLKNVIHVKQVVQLLLDDVDPNGFIASLHSSATNSPVNLIVRDLTNLMSDLDTLIKQFNITDADGSVLDRFADREAILALYRQWLEPLRSPYLASPMQDMMFDDRIEFFKKRNDILVANDFDALIDHYESNSCLFEGDIEHHAEYCLALGHIYGDLLQNNEKAAAAFEEALQYDPTNSEAFDLVSRHLREASNWDALIELLSNHWDAVDNVQKRCDMLRECAAIQAFHCQNIPEAIGLYERCMIEGNPGNCFDDIYKIVFGLMEDSTNMERLRVLVTLSMHITKYEQRDKVVELQKKFNDSDEPASQCLNYLIQAGNSSFSGDQPEALEFVRKAFVANPANTLIEGVLHRIVSKIGSMKEFDEVMDDIDSESISVRDLSLVLMRIAKVLKRFPEKANYALSYAEHAVDVDATNDDAIAICYDLSKQLSLQAKTFVYASLKLARCKNEKERNELETICEELKISFADQDDVLIDVYETCLQFEPLRNNIGDDLKSLMSTISDDKAVTLIQRVESLCVSNGLTNLMGELYESVLERPIAANIRKSLLERYLGMLNGQTDNQARDTFLRIHAQLFCISPSPYLATLLEKFTAKDESALRTWAGYIEEAMADIEDSSTKIKLYATLTHIFLDILKDDENAAESAKNILNLDPSSVVAFKTCFSCNERREDYFECCELFKSFPIDKFPSEDRKYYAQKTLRFALINLYDTDKMLFSIRTLIANHPEIVLPLMDQMFRWQEKSDLSREQLICFFDMFEKQSDDYLKAVFHAIRAELLIKEGRDEEGLALLDAAFRTQALQTDATLPLSTRVKNVLSALTVNDNNKSVIDLWCSGTSDAPKAKSAEIKAIDRSKLPKLGDKLKSGDNKALDESSILKDKLKSGDQKAVSGEVKAVKSEPKISAEENAAFQKMDSLVAACRDNMDDANAFARVDEAIAEFEPRFKTALCLKIGALCEEQNRKDSAEKYYKMAFSFTQSYELLEFYKRNRKFKKALKIAQFKEKQMPDAADKAAALIDQALIYQQLGDFKNASTCLDTVLTNYSDMYAKVEMINIQRQKAALAIAMHDNDSAIAILNQAATDIAKQDPKLKEEIDIDLCFLLRDAGQADEARKKWQQLTLKNVKNVRMQLFALCADVDANKLAEAEKKYKALLNDVTGTPMEVTAHEQYLRICEKRDDADAVQNVANQILALDPTNALALKVIQK